MRRLVGGDSPQLRIVDPSATGDAWESPEDIPEAAWGLAGLASEAARQGVILSMENSGSPLAAWRCWSKLSRERMPEEYRSYLGLCPDPTTSFDGFLIPSP